MSKEFVFTSESSPSLTVTMGALGVVNFRDGVARLTDEAQADELRTWAELNPGYKVSEGEPKPPKKDEAEKEKTPAAK